MADGEPEPLYQVTHSKVQRFLRCKQEFWFDYVSGYEWPPEPMTAPGIVGTGVHQALRALCETDREEAGRAALEAYLRMPAHTSAAAGTNWYEIANDLYARGAAIHRQLATPDDHRWAEKVAGFPHRPGGIAIQSTIDRVDWVGPERWQVIDWKTGRFESDAITDAQLDLAHAALRASFRSRLGRDHTVKAMAINLLPGREPRVRELIRADAVATVAYYADLARQMRANEDWRPTPGPYCGFCRWRPQCPAGDREDEATLDWLLEDGDEAE